MTSLNHGYATLGFSFSELEYFLQNTDFPATKREILDVAMDNGASDDILLFLNKMEDQEYLAREHLFIGLNYLLQNYL